MPKEEAAEYLYSREIISAIHVLRVQKLDLRLVQEMVNALKKENFGKNFYLAPAAINKAIVRIFHAWEEKQKIRWFLGYGGTELFFAYKTAAIASTLKLNNSAEEIVFEIYARLDHRKTGSIEASVDSYSRTDSGCFNYLLHVEALKQAGIGKKFNNEKLYKIGLEIIKKADKRYTEMIHEEENLRKAGFSQYVIDY